MLSSNIQLTQHHNMFLYYHDITIFNHTYVTWYSFQPIFPVTPFIDDELCLTFFSGFSASSFLTDVHVHVPHIIPPGHKRYIPTYRDTLIKSSWILWFWFTRTRKIFPWPMPPFLIIELAVSCSVPLSFWFPFPPYHISAVQYWAIKYTTWTITSAFIGTLWHIIEINTLY